jgi:ABC-type amino acid transport substrate-binding protein
MSELGGGAFTTTRRALFVGGGGLVALGAAACTQQPNNAQASGNGKLSAAYILYPPFVTKDPNTGALSGFFIELMQDVADFAKFSIDYVEGKWGTMVAGLESNQFDLVVSAIFPTIPRAMAINFATPVMYIGLSGVVPATGAVINTVEDLRKPGIRLAVIAGEVGHEYAKRYLPEATLVTIDSADISRALEEVVAGRADIALTESITCVLFAEKNDKVKAIFTNPPLQTFGATVMLRHEDEQLRDFINSSINFLEASGRLADLDKKYRSDRPLWLPRRAPWA